MPFPWEQAIQAGVQIGGQYAASKKSSGASEKEIGKAFDQFDIALAGALGNLQKQTTVTVDQLNNAGAAYGQLQGFAQQYSGIEYVARQWASEEPRYAAIFQSLVVKLPAAQAVATGAVTPIGATNLTPSGAGAVTAGSTATGTPGGVDTQTLLIIAALALGVVLLVKR